MLKSNHGHPARVSRATRGWGQRRGSRGRGWGLGAGAEGAGRGWGVHGVQAGQGGKVAEDSPPHLEHILVKQSSAERGAGRPWGWGRLAVCGVQAWAAQMSLVKGSSPGGADAWPCPSCALEPLCAGCAATRGLAGREEAIKTCRPAGHHPSHGSCCSLRLSLCLRPLPSGPLSVCLP